MNSIRRMLPLLCVFFAVLPCSAISEEVASIRELSGEGVDPSLDRLRFSDRTQLDPRYEKYLKAEPGLLTDWKTSILLPAPPQNSSPQTKAELRYLHELIEKRTPRQEKAIIRQIEVAGMKLGPHQMKTILGKSSARPATRSMLNIAQREMEILVFRLKVKFDRPRPDALDPTLSLSIPNPRHPAYPSGHSTQAHLLAYLLTEIDPKNQQGYLRAAQEIARNREVAGVHYPSDSEAGRLLARQITDQLLEVESFQALVEAARAEYPQG